MAQTGIQHDIIDSAALKANLFRDSTFKLLVCVQNPHDACDEMIRLGKITGRRDLLRLAENCAGAVEGERGNLESTIVHYSTALSIARELSDRTAERWVLVNLASRFNTQGCIGMLSLATLRQYSL